MKLLICTQAMDRKHPVLGFFHRWVEEFAKHFDRVHVICLFEGDHNLPSNVTVHSLGKEGGESRLKYLWRFYKFSWQLRHEYDVVFVHMIPEYVLIGAPVWFVVRKPITLWYTHGTVSVPLRLANLLVKHIFTADRVGLNLRSEKVVFTGHGIDFTQFESPPVSRDLDLLTIGRITPSKNLEELIDALIMVRRELPWVVLTVVGEVGSEKDEQYLKALKKRIKDAGHPEGVCFMGAIPHDDVPILLKRSKVFVHAAKNGSLDKVLLEAIAARTPVVTNALGAGSIPLGEWSVIDGRGFLNAIMQILKRETPQTKVDDLYSYVKKEHNIVTLVKRLHDSLCH